MLYRPWSLGTMRQCGFRNCVTLTFDLWVNTCRATAIEYMCTKFGVDSSSRFLVRAWTDRQTERRD